MSRTRRVAVILAVASLLLVLAMSIGLPLVRWHFRRMSSRTPTSDRLHQIGIGILLYTFDHHGAYPPTLPALARAEGLAPDLPLCPDEDGADTPTAYVYLGRRLTDATSDYATVVAHEPPSFFGGVGCNVLFGDGHLDYVTAADLPAVLARGGPATRPTTAPAAVRSDHG